MKIHTDHITKAIDQGIYFLADHQFHHGEFCCYVGAGEDLKDWCIPDSSNFTTAIIGISLLPLKGDKTVDSMLQKAADFLIYQMMRGGTWGYYTKMHKGFNLCPADVDDTACVSVFLKELGYTIPDNIPMLLDNSTKKGLFYTWFTLRFNLSRNPNYWKLLLRELKYPIKNIFLWTRNTWSKSDVDAGINANVLFYLGLSDATSRVVPYLLNIIKEQRETQCDKWYNNPFMIYYFISRCYYKGIKELEPVIKPIEERIMKTRQDNGRMGNTAADTALAINTLLNFNRCLPETESAVNYLLQTQNKNGSWPRQALCWIPSAKVGFGSEELTTGVCLEALARYRKMKTEQIVIEQGLHEVS